jgi:beta-phosphoglucomutase-like phosphatase (HAD superfamily)
VQLSPPHPEVEEALRLLKGAGFRLAALTNNGQSVVDAQLENSGLAQYFEKILSADTIKVGSFTNQRPGICLTGAAKSYDTSGLKSAFFCLDRALLRISLSRSSLADR